MDLIELKRRLHALRPPRRSTGNAAITGRLGELFAPDHVMHAGCPIDDCLGLAEQADRLWGPLLTALPDMERRDDILLTGISPAGDVWLALTGHYLGTFTRPWLRIPPTGRPAWLRFGVFHRVADGLIRELHLLLDIIGLMRQAGVCPLPEGNGVEVLVPGPAGGNGVTLAPLPADEGTRSLALVTTMHGATQPGSHWHQDLMWYGPTGLGTLRGLDSLRLIPPADAGNDVLIAEGAFAAAAGWSGSRAMTWWRREGALLAEAWMLTDTPHALRRSGGDAFAHLPA